MWIATDEGVSRIAGNETQNYQERDGLAYFSTRSLVEDSNGDIWIGTDHGLSHLHGRRLRSRCGDSGTRRRKVWSILEDHDGALWFGTRSHGLFRYAKGTIVVGTTAQGLANNNIYQLLADRRGSLWLSGPTTISSFPLPPQELDRIRHAPQGECLRITGRCGAGTNVRRPAALRLRGPATATSGLPAAKVRGRVLPVPALPSGPAESTDHRDHGRRT